MPENEDSPPSTSPARRSHQLPALAPRNPSSTARDRSSASTSASSRPSRLSHRSRQGCWTCRARKVKCDEVHPKCGPCTRLNRECDWDHRWNFSNATSSTQVKYSNVKTTGNVVWDPEAQPASSPTRLTAAQDDMPAFNALATDEERERKAETKLPGTYGVVITPDSFADLPEYASTSADTSRRTSLASHRSSFVLPSSNSTRLSLRARTDPDVIVLDRFEDASPTSVLPFPLSSSPRRLSVPDNLQNLSIDSSPIIESSAFENLAPPVEGSNDDALIAHFRRYVVNRLIQPQLEGTNPDIVAPGATRDVFEVASMQFLPLRHAICAVSALNLAYSNRSTIEEALQHYHQALSTASANDDLSSDGVFLRHFLLLIFDVCFTIPHDAGTADTWTIHLNNLRQSALLRKQLRASEPFAYLLWRICEFDMYACLLGSGMCEFLSTLIRLDMIPALEQQIPIVMPSLPMRYLGNETDTFPDIIALHQAVVIQTANLARAAQEFRHEAAMTDRVPPSMMAQWQARVTQLQHELLTYWMQGYPQYLDVENPRAAGEQLPERVRCIYEQVVTLYHAALIYSRTSMFPGQRRIPIANQLQIHADSERRIAAIISIAMLQVEQNHLERRHMVFALFMAGFATSQADVKIHALDLMSSYERSGIGQNTMRTRQLLKTVYEEQRRRADEGGRMEDVDWLELAKARSLAVVNCGL